MKLQSKCWLVTLLSLMCCCLSVTIVAQPPDLDSQVFRNGVAKDQPLATATRSGNEIKWAPKVPYESLVLTVSLPNGEVFRQEFGAGEAPVFKLIAENGGGLPDGSYHYELRLAPKIDEDVKKQLRQARENGNDAALERELKQSGKLPPGEIVQTGSFLIARGSVQVAKQEGGEKEEALQKVSARPAGNANNSRLLPASLAKFDQVIPDDLIVQGSACVGLDCVNNESFGFDTIRLKENNLRINFTDTSTTAGFPTNDWELTANDSASGGASRFSIRDVTAARDLFTVRAGAAANSIFVDSTGRVGFRTSTPVLDTHVTTGNTPAHRLEQNGSGGFTAQTWDVAGNEANFFVRDVTSGSRLPFRIRPGAPTSSLDISADGDVGIGTASPSEKLHMDVAGATSDVLLRQENDTRAWSLGINGASDFWRITDQTAGAARLVISNTGNIGLGGQTAPTSPIHHNNGATLSAGGLWLNSSSRTLKTNIRNLSSREAFTALQQMKPVTFQYKAEPGENHVGFIAEDVPDLIATRDRKNLSSMDVVAVLTQVVKEQQQLIADLKIKVDRLEKAQAKTARRAKKR
jgi:hypothetical protein